MDYLTLKWLHVLSATVLVGTGFGSALHLFLAHRGGDRRAIAVVARQVVWVDWVLTAPAVVFQLASGLWLAALAGYPLDQLWLAASLGLYAVAGLAWLPVLWLQVRIRDLARQAGAEDLRGVRLYRRYMRLWTLLGTVGFGSMIAVYWLMVHKPR